MRTKKIFICIVLLICSLALFAACKDDGKCKHNYVDTVTAPTCTEGGITLHKCSLCGAQYRDGIKEALGHDYTGEVTAPTCAEGGYTVFKCSRCKDTYTGDETAPKGHVSDGSSTVVAPAFDTAGYTESHCTVCGQDYKYDIIDEYGKHIDFAVNVEAGREAKVLQLTDTQIIDSAQQRSADRLGGYAYNRWATNTTEENYKKYVTQVIQKTEPDLIIITGDLVYGEFDDNGTVLLGLIKFMDSFDIPWAPVFGNHDNESKKGVDWQCEQLEAAQNCLFKQRTLTGNGNYTVGIFQGGKLTRVFYMLDSNGCGGASEESKANGHTKTSVGFGQDQIDWYTAGMNAVKKSYGDVKISMAFHIQTAAFAPAYEKYDYSTALNGNKDLLTPIDLGNGGDGGDFGYLGRNPKGPWGGDLFVKMKASGVDSVFVGHEHCNSISVVYEGVRLQYGQKSSTYDRANYLTKDDTIVGSYEEKGTPIVGGTIIPLSEEGVITKPALVLYKEEVVDVPVYTSVFDFNGTDFDTDVTTSGLTTFASEPISSGVPAGGDGGVYGNESYNLISVGINFNFNINVEDLKTFKIRMYVSDYTVATGKAALVRLYDATNNSILAGKSFSDAEGKTGEWCEVDILPLIKEEKAFSALVSEGKLQPLSLVYRAYAATGETAQVYFDSVIIESLVDYSLSEAA